MIPSAFVTADKLPLIPRGGRGNHAVSREVQMRKANAEAHSSTLPPALAERLLLLVLPAKLGGAVVGDLAERFPLIQERHGARFARVWYWRQALGSAFRLLGLKAILTGALLRLARRLLSL
jgi:hypothetical protein